MGGLNCSESGEKSIDNQLQMNTNSKTHVIRLSEDGHGSPLGKKEIGEKSTICSADSASCVNNTFEEVDRMNNPSKNIFRINRKEFRNKVAAPVFDNKYTEVPSQGPLMLEDGSTYKGQFKKGRRYGFGEIVYANGQMYEGYWDNDKRNGLGRFFMLNGNVYDGMWANDLWHGPGKLYFSKNEYYEGSFEYGKRSGLGRHNFADGSYFEGRWVEDKRDGEGTYFNANTGESIPQSWSEGALLLKNR